MAKRERDATVQLKLRMKEPLRAELAAEAERNGVSLNSEIVNRLQRSLTEGALASRVAADELWAMMSVLDMPTGIIKKHHSVYNAFNPKSFGDFGALFIGFFQKLKDIYEKRGHTIKASGPSWVTGEKMAIYFDTFAHLAAAAPDDANAEQLTQLQASAWDSAWGTKE